MAVDEDQHVDDPAARRQPAGRCDQQDHDAHDAARVAVDLLHDAGRSGHLLDRQQHPRHPA